MSMFVRRALLVGVAALFSAQAATAAPRSLSSVDPLVALSVFGTAQSRTAVCAAGAAAAAAGAATLAGSAAATAAQGPRPGCVLPVIASAPPPLVGQAPPPPYRAPFQIGAWAVIPALLGLAALVLFALNDDDNPIVPISPF